jgi:uncharacterized protein YodC (DUF2158 family)
MSESNHIFNIGDVVTLKSGGPNMVITEFFFEDSYPMYTCKWFNEEEVLKEEDFEQDVIN